MSGSADQIVRDIEELRKLRSSRGYALLAETINNDAVAAAWGMAEKLTMPIEEIHFRRGAIHAARGFLNALETLIVQKENELLLASAKAEDHNLNAMA